jgi:hypothetical protein
MEHVMDPGYPSDGEILAKRESNRKARRALWASIEEEADRLDKEYNRIPPTTEERMMLGKASSRLRVTDPGVDYDMWHLFSEHLVALPVNRFNIDDVLGWVKKISNINWSSLVANEDWPVLQKYGFDKEAFRRARNRFFVTLRKRVHEEMPGEGFAPLDRIADALRKHLPAAIFSQIHFESLEKRFVARWENRIQRARGEELYRTSEPHKRRLEEIEQEMQQLREKRPRLFEHESSRK